jgi:hypothetical protein
MSYVSDKFESDPLKILDQIHWDILKQLNHFNDLTKNVSLYLQKQDYISAHKLIESLQQSYDNVRNIRIK